ncbi:tetratricopeptide repeat protein [bacterium]|nr:tetratricopeptide repeat protein [bacterium]
MKKLLSALFSLFVLAAIVTAAYFNLDFIKAQAAKVEGMYYVYKGDKSYSKLQMQKAIGFYNKGLSIYPEHYEAWYNLGNIYVAYEDYESALYAYSQAFKYNPRMMVARMNYGIISAEKSGDFDSALEQYNKIIKTKRKLLSIPYVFNNKVSYKDNKAIAYYNIGVTYRLKSLYANDNWEEQRKYLAKAIDAYKKSIKINPNSYDTQYNLGLAYHISGNYTDAGKSYCNAIKIAPMNYEAHYNLAILLKKLGHYQEAYDEIDKASTLISAIDENPATRQYVSIVMNDIMRNVYHNEEYKKYLQNILEEEKRKTKILSKKDRKVKPEKDKEQKEPIRSRGIDFINGKIVATDELDKAMLENFGKCSAMSYFNPVEEDELF